MPVTNEVLLSERETLNGLPIVLGKLVRLAKTRPHTAYIEVRCPTCGRVNTHGWDTRDGFKQRTHRYEHCNCRAGGYYIGLTPNSPHCVPIPEDDFR